jgi:hypothetical protein
VTLSGGTCGDGIVQATGGETCDGGSSGSSKSFTPLIYADAASMQQFCLGQNYLNASSYVTSTNYYGSYSRWDTGTNSWDNNLPDFGARIPVVMSVTCATPANGNNCIPNSGSCNYCSSNNCQTNTISCTITNVTVTPDNCAGNVCSQGNRLNISINYTGSCSTANFAQVDLKSVDDKCIIEAIGGNMSGINGNITPTNGNAKFSYTLPSIPSTCAGTFIGTGTVNSAALRVGSYTGTPISNFYSQTNTPTGNIILDNCITPTRKNYVNYAKFTESPVAINALNNSGTYIGECVNNKYTPINTTPQNSIIIPVISINTTPQTKTYNQPTHNTYAICSGAGTNNDIQFCKENGYNTVSSESTDPSSNTCTYYTGTTWNNATAYTKYYNTITCNNQTTILKNQQYNCGDTDGICTTEYGKQCTNDPDCGTHTYEKCGVTYNGTAFVSSCNSTDINGNAIHRACINPTDCVFKQVNNTLSCIPNASDINNTAGHEIVCIGDKNNAWCPKGYTYDILSGQCIFVSNPCESTCPQVLSSNTLITNYFNNSNCFVFNNTKKNNGLCNVFRLAFT